MRKEMRKIRQLTPEEAWQISCHEAGHAIAGVRLNLPFMNVIRGEGEHAETPIGNNPINCPNAPWADEAISRWQLFYAAGPAAEELEFGQYRDYAAREDRKLHGWLEKKRKINRIDGWSQDIQAAIKILDRKSIEKVAKELEAHGTLNEEKVYALLGYVCPFS